MQIETEQAPRNETEPTQTVKRTVRLEKTGSLFCCGSNSFSPLISTLSLLSFHHPLSLVSTSTKPMGLGALYCTHEFLTDAPTKRFQGKSLRYHWTK